MTDLVPVIIYVPSSIKELFKQSMERTGLTESAGGRILIERFLLDNPDYAEDFKKLMDETTEKRRKNLDIHRWRKGRRKIAS